MAYGARLESVLGESPRGFESPILRVVKGAVPKGRRLSQSWGCCGLDPLGRAHTARGSARREAARGEAVGTNPPSSAL